MCSFNPPLNLNTRSAKLLLLVCLSVYVVYDNLQLPLQRVQPTNALSQVCNALESCTSCSESCILLWILFAYVCSYKICCKSFNPKRK